MGAPNHRVAAGTKIARQLAARNQRIVTQIWPAGKSKEQREIEEWNRAVEERKAAKRAAKQER